MACAELQSIGGGIGGDAEQRGVAKRDQPGVTGENVQAEREHGVEQDLAGDVDVIIAAQPVWQSDEHEQRDRQGDDTPAHGTNLPNRPCGRKISTSSMGRNSTK